MKPMRLMILDLATQKWSELRRGSFHQFDFSEDGKSVYFDTEWADDPGIYRIGISDHKLGKIADLKGVPQTYDDFGMWWEMTPDGSPLLLPAIPAASRSTRWTYNSHSRCGHC